MNAADEIKSKLDLVDVLGEYISLRPAGSNLRALCPFHNEKTPSFMASPEKQIWHCFGCGKGGDVLGFVMEMEGLTFMETLRLLAPRAGVTLKMEDVKEVSRRNRLLDVLLAAQEYYQRLMLRNASIKDYLKERGLREQTVREWKIGYSSESWDDLLLYLADKKFTKEEIFLAGLSFKKEGTAKYYNRFRDRIMFPLNDIAGNIVGFSARLNPQTKGSESEKMGKYINSPQTPVYDKSRLLFGLDKAKGAIKAQDLAIVVEGQMDVISCHQAGYKNVVASSGTALTLEQVKLIRRYTNNIALAFDADSAGQMAADRGITEALAQEMNVRVIVIPNGKDPDECLKDNPADWEAAVKAAPPMMQYYFDKIFNGIDVHNVDDKRSAARKMLAMIARLSNRVEIDHWLKKVSEKINVEENLLRETLQASLSEVKRNHKEVAAINPVLNKSESREEKLSALLLALTIKFPDFIEYVANNLNPEYLLGLENRLFYNHLIIYYNDNKEIEYRKFRAYLEANEVGYVNLLDTFTLLADKDFPESEPEQIKAEIIRLILELKKAYYKAQMRLAEQSLAQAEAAKDQARVAQLLQTLKDLTDKFKALDIY